MGHPSRFGGHRITSVDEYHGGPAVRISATQLGSEYSMRQARKIVDAWCEFLRAGPTPISELAFATRTPKRLFASLTGQTQLTALAIKWGDYDDLRPIAAMPGLRKLRLGGASSVRTLAPLADLPGLHTLAIEDVRYVHDLSPLATLTGLRSLEVGGNWRSPRIAHVDSIAFLRKLRGLERLVLHTIVADDLDYSPLLDLHDLHTIRVARVRGMRPSHDELCAAIPALAPISQ